MFITDLATAGALPALEATVRFAGQRQKLIANNVANFDTPDYRPMDVDARGFQAQLRDAVERRRGVGAGGMGAVGATGGTHGALGIRPTSEVRVDGSGELRLVAQSATGNVLAHDRNNRDLERTMQDMVENAGQFRVAADLLRNRLGLLKGAIREAP